MGRFPVFDFFITKIKDFFRLEEPELQEPLPRMFQSYYEGVRPPRGYGKQNPWNGPERGTWTRKRYTNVRSQSMSPAKVSRNR